MLLRYTGKHPDPVTFMALGREVAPDEQFTVPDDQAGAYLARTDVEQVVPPKKTSRAARASTAPDPGPPPAPEDATPAAQAPDETTN